MPFRPLKCPHCGGPLPPRGWRAVVTCGFCNRSVALDGEVVRAADYRRALAEEETGAGEGRRVVRVNQVGYRVLGRLACGEICDVLLAARARSLTERVVIKVLREPANAGLLDREWEALTALQQSTSPGSEHFSQRLPQPVCRGQLQKGDERPALVLRFLAGFIHTLEDVAREHPSLDPRHAVWIWRRVLELLSFVHQSGWVHGALLPQHLLVHPRDHGVAFAGWSAAASTAPGAFVAGMDKSRSAFYPSTHSSVLPETDLVMAARCVAWALSGSPTEVPSCVSAPLAELLCACLQPRDLPTRDAWALACEVAAAAASAFGPAKFVNLAMPGWSPA